MNRAIHTILPLSLAFACLGCSTSRDGWNSVREARFQQQEKHLTTAADRARLHLRQLEASLRQAELDVEAMKVRSLVAEETRRSESAKLEAELARQKAMEQDLKAAKQRQAEIEKELVPLRKLEGLLSEKGKRLVALQTAIDAEGKKVQVLEAQLKARQAEVNGITLTLQKRTAELVKVVAALKAAQLTSEPFFRPAPAAPPKSAAPKAKAPVKKK